VGHGRTHGSEIFPTLADRPLRRRPPPPAAVVRGGRAAVRG
jgi:hypothetical protein